MSSSAMIPPVRWVAYFDILGFADMVRGSSPPELILGRYKKVLKILREELKEVPVLRTGHFSDSFIIYSDDGSMQAYSWLQSKAKNFIRRCIHDEIPFRGAISFGEFYVDDQDGIYFGKALIEAYLEAESQDWIGLILTKSAEGEVKKRLNPELHHYRTASVPKKVRSNDSETQIATHPAYIFPGHPLSTIPALEAMRNRAPVMAQHKFTNTIEHIRRFNDGAGIDVK